MQALGFAGHGSRRFGRVLAFALVAALSACTLPRAAPTVGEVQADIEASSTLALVPVTLERVEVLSKLADNRPGSGPFFPDNEGSNGLLGPGDVLRITVIETAAGGLFSRNDPGSSASGAQVAPLPDMQINAAGQINFPYLGVLRVSGLDELALGQVLAQKLSEQTPSPNVIVHRIEDRSNPVVVMGEVRSPGMISLSAARETLLQAIAMAGGNTSPPNDTVVRLTRAGVSRTVRLSTLLDQPDKDIHLRRGDRVTLEDDRLSYTVLGASSAQVTKHFPSAGITLAEALGSGGGLNDVRADLAGVFVLRHERNSTLKKLGITPPGSGATSPTVYQFDMTHVEGAFAANGFPLQPSDLVLIANANSVQFNKAVSAFLGVVRSADTAQSLATSF